MKHDTPLLGLDYLVSRLIFHDEALELRPANRPAPLAGELIAGMPLDPLLALLYSRYDCARLGNLFVTRLADLAHDNDPDRWNIEDDGRPSKLFSYAGISGFSFDFSTVPSLASAEGFQPVVFFIGHDDWPIDPIASNVDQAFRLYGMYCDKCHAAGGTLADPPLDVLFPGCMVKEIARDRPLVEMIEAGRFDFLMRPYPAPPDEDREWHRSILREAKALR